MKVTSTGPSVCMYLPGNMHEVLLGPTIVKLSKNINYCHKTTSNTMDNTSDIKINSVYDVNLPSKCEYIDIEMDTSFRYIKVNGASISSLDSYHITHINIFRCIISIFSKEGLVFNIDLPDVSDLFLSNKCYIDASDDVLSIAIY